MHKATPLTIRGVEYPSQLAAAKALGISVPAICNAKKRGTLETVGLNPKRTEPSPVMIRGVVYRSQYAAAKALGLAASTIWNALERGSLENAGKRKMK